MGAWRKMFPWLFAAGMLSYPVFNIVSSGLESDARFSGSLLERIGRPGEDEEAGSRKRNLEIRVLNGFGEPKKLSVWKFKKDDESSFFYLNVSFLKNVRCRLSLGRYKALVSSELGCSEMEFSVGENDLKRDVFLEPWRLVLGEVSDADSGKLIAFSSVFFKNRSRDFDYYREFVCGGKFVARLFPDEKMESFYDVRVVAKGYETLDETMKIQSDKIKFALKKKKVFKFRLRDGEGDVYRAFVEVYDRRKGKKLWKNVLPDGPLYKVLYFSEKERELATGERENFILKIFLRNAPEQAFSFNPFEERTRQYRVICDGRIEGEFVSGEDSLDNVFYKLNFFNAGIVRKYPHLKETEGGGSFEFDGLGAGEYELSFARDGYEPGKIKIKIGESKKLWRKKVRLLMRKER